MSLNRLLPAMFIATSALLPVLATGCAGDESESSEESDLTSLRGQSRSLQFQGIVYVARGASDSEILNAVHAQTKTAFGPLKQHEIGVNDRELKGVSPSTFVKREVTVVDTTKSGDKGSPMLEVRYTYADDAIVPESLATKSTLDIALLGPDYRGKQTEILEKCTANNAEARDFAGDLWYVFEPDRSSCRTVIQKEQDGIAAARIKLTDPTSQVPLVESRRIYLPATIALGPDATNGKDSYPEYDRLFTGGIKKGKLIISLLNGTIDHDPPAGGLQDDSGYGEWMASLQEVFAAQPGFEVYDIEDDVDVESFELSSGKVIDGLAFQDFVAQHDGTALPGDLSYDEEREVTKQFAERIVDHWVTFRVKGRVKIGTKREKDVEIRLQTYFGEAYSTEPFKYAIKNSDVFLYNGHSMIGNGPLDPKNFSTSDFPASYQILFVDSCISYNYYSADYIPLKSGGTKNLDLVTNALESPSWQSGYALGQFIVTLIDGKNATWLELLESAEATGSGMRVVDGELDNVFDGTKTPIKLSL